MKIIQYLTKSCQKELREHPKTYGIGAGITALVASVGLLLIASALAGWDTTAATSLLDNVAVGGGSFIADRILEIGIGVTAIGICGGASAIALACLKEAGIQEKNSPIARSRRT